MIRLRADTFSCRVREFSEQLLDLKVTLKQWCSLLPSACQGDTLHTPPKVPPEAFLFLRTSYAPEPSCSAASASQGVGQPNPLPVLCVHPTCRSRLAHNMCVPGMGLALPSWETHPDSAGQTAPHTSCSVHCSSLLPGAERVLAASL